MPEFASLEPQDVRDYWNHEARDFTPWLADEIEAEGASRLEDSLEIDLEVIETEKRVGKYNVDIFARVVDDGRKVIIENQLGDSDHDHLGKSIAYAAGLDADIIVWLAPEFNDEHRDAFEWLNRNSREGIDLFAIRLEVWRIGESAPAARFNPVEKPSEWKEKAKRSKRELSERDELREEFWTEFRDHIQDEQTPLRPRKPYPRHYYQNPIGATGYHLAYSIDEDDNELSLSLIIEDSAAAHRLLNEQAEEIEAELGTEVEWGDLRETRTGNMRSDLSITRDADIHNRARWDEYFEWMLAMGERFHDVFPQRLQKVD